MKQQVKVQLKSEKNCFTNVHVSLLSSTGSDLAVFRGTAGKNVAYFSALPSSAVRRDALCINGMYANKLGLRANASVLLEEMTNTRPCVSCSMEPVSVDDWEILELHADQVENSLLDQVRVVWVGQVFPLWIDDNVCIFIRTVQVEPAEDCVVLIPLTEMIVAPKGRHSAVPSQQSSKPSTLPDEKTQVSDLPSLNNVIDSDVEAGTTETAVSTLSYRRWLYDMFWKVVRYITNSYLSRAFLFLFIFFPKLVYTNVVRYVSTFSRLEHTETNHSIAVQKNNSDLERILTDAAWTVPQSFRATMRVYPIDDLLSHRDAYQTSDLSQDQSNTLYLHTHGTPVTKEDAVMYLVEVAKCLSPNERNQVKKVDPTTWYLVRMYTHPITWASMTLCPDKLCHYHTLKLSSSLRKQLSAGVSSKVRLRRVKDVPRSCDDVVKLVFIVDDENIPKLPKDKEHIAFVESFKYWLSTVADSRNPLPISRNSVLSFPLWFNDVVLAQLNVLVSQITEADENSKASKSFMISAEDLSHIKLTFVISDKLSEKWQVDPPLPVETYASYSKGFEEECDKATRFVEQALSLRPLNVGLMSTTCSLKPNCLLVTGASGTGKTTLCRAILHRFATDCKVNAYIETFECRSYRGKKPDTVKRYLEKLYSELSWRQPSLLLIDDLDALVPAGTELAAAGNDPGEFYTLQLIIVLKEFFKLIAGRRATSWDCNPPKIVVLATCKSKTSLHSVLTSSTNIFSDSVDLGLPDTKRRALLFESLIMNTTDYIVPDDLKLVVEGTDGYALSDLRSIVQRACHLVQQRSVDNAQTEVSVNPLELTSEDLYLSLDGYTPCSLQNVELHKPASQSWTDVGGLLAIKEQLTELLIWPLKHRRLFEQVGLPANSGIFLYGPPGCGKTLIASVIANECKLNFISVKGPELLSKYIGASEAAVRNTFSRARAASPCILFFDEFESLAPQRGHDNTGVTDRVVNQLLTQLDGVEPLTGVTVLAASSRPDLVDAALLRPGRLDHHLAFSLPDEDERYEILQSLSKSMTLHSDADLRSVARQCEYFSGADLKSLLYNAQLESIHDVKTDSSLEITDLNTTTSSSKIDTSDSYEYLNQSSGKAPKGNGSESTSSLPDSHHELVDSRWHDYYDIKSSVDESKSQRTSVRSSQLEYFPTVHQGRSNHVPDFIQKEVSIFNKVVTGDYQMEEETSGSTGESKLLLTVTQEHLEKAFLSTQPSLPESERQKFDKIYASFQEARQKKMIGDESTSRQNEKPRVTLS